MLKTWQLEVNRDELLLILSSLRVAITDLKRCMIEGDEVRLDALRSLHNRLLKEIAEVQ